jgi:RNA recognition motif-containing protein
LNLPAQRTPESAIATIPRGPPRKPKQSGHALWVGNLPPGASIFALKDHFSRDAKREIESLFLISKSNCAFVNYRNEDACEKAVTRFHESRFQGVRLVCRLRKSSSAPSGVPSRPSSMAGARTTPASSGKAPIMDGHDDDEDQEAALDSSSDDEVNKPAKYSERYFIVKSLTLQDLKQSIRNGVWATQSHNEDALNKAYNVSLSDTR